MQGICPDMCPEKERLMREAKHQIGIYEADETAKNTIVHPLAVKQYSRSSADQEAPLPHELRPEPVLRMTLNYLLHRIVNLCDSSDVNLSDWFHFLWDRTRAIRKDITQQELCSPLAVSLIEQCARFHIHCSARLVAEEPQVFDQKINTENLTKCLQSLKYMYHDLALKRERCPNEAEFRAYVVLLNLHDSNFLWEVKQLPKDLLHSAEIRFAIGVYLAMESNNYVRFFQLVRQTTYMNACILLRYFVQVRVRALNVMVKSYVPRAPVPMSIAYWSYILAFEDFEQCAQFLEYYGLQCDRDDDRVLLDRNSFCYPDLPIFLERAVNVVEHKRMCSVGEAVHGGTELDAMDTFEGHVPHDSFDEAGYLMGDAYTAGDQDYRRPATPKGGQRMVVSSSPSFSIQQQQQQQLSLSASPSLEDTNLFKIPQIPQTMTQMKSQQYPKPSIFTKLSPKAETDGFDEGSGGGTASIFGKPDAGMASARNIFAISTTAATETTKNIFQIQPVGMSAAGKGVSGNIFGMPSTTGTTGAQTQKNIFQLSATQFGDIDNSGTELFGGSKFSTHTKAMSVGIFGMSPAPATGKADTLFMDVPPPKLSSEKTETASAEQETLAAAKELEIKRREQELRRKQMQLQQAEEELRHERIRIGAATVCEDIVNEWIADEIARIAKLHLKRFQMIGVAAERLATTMMADVIEETLVDIAQSEISTQSERYLMFEYFWRWRINARGRIEKRQKLERIDCTPLWLSERVTSETVRQLVHPSQKVCVFIGLFVQSLEFRRSWV